VWLFDGAENGKWVQDLRRELEKREAQEKVERRIPAVIADSGNSTRFPSPDSEMLNLRKRDYLDVSGEEPVMKKVKSEQNLTG
jgi:7-keto-8-aminopelargonate synthetase-like enzyme